MENFLKVKTFKTSTSNHLFANRKLTYDIFLCTGPGLQAGPAPGAAGDHKEYSTSLAESRDCSLVFVGNVHL